MKTSLVKIQIGEVSVYISYELQQVYCWLLNYLTPETYYIKRIFEQYRVANLNIAQISKEISQDARIEDDTITINIITDLAIELVAYLENYNDGNILKEVKKILYKVYSKEAVRIITFSDEIFEDLAIIFNKADNLDMSIKSLAKDLDEYLLNVINQNLNEDIFNQFINELNEILSSNDELNFEAERQLDILFNDIKANIYSVIDD